MTSKTTLMTTFVAVTLVLGLSVAPAMVYAIPGYATVNSATADEKDGTLLLSVTTGGDIPRFADDFINSVLVFGFAWADLDSGKVVLTTIHPTIGRDSNQNPDNWHTHPGQLGPGTENSAFCVVTLGTSQGGISIKGDTLSLNIETSQAGVTLAELDGAVGFTVISDNACGLGLGVSPTANPVGFS
jgi:hypothetical protein